MKFLCVFLFSILALVVSAQHLQVITAKDAFTEGGLHLQENVAVPVDCWIVVKDNGYVYFSSNTGWTFKLTEGKHNLRTYYDINKRRYAEHDSVKAIVDALFPGGITGRQPNICTTDFSGNIQELCYKQGYIAFSDVNNNGTIKVQQDSVYILRWRDPKYVTGRYFLVFKNVFDEIVDYRISTTTSYTIHFNNLVDDMIYIVYVYSEDNRCSMPINIQKIK